MRSSEIRIKAEMEIDCFLAHIIGAKDSLLGCSVAPVAEPCQGLKLK